MSGFNQFQQNALQKIFSRTLTNPAFGGNGENSVVIPIPQQGSFAQYRLIVSNMGTQTVGDSIYLQVSLDGGITWAGANNYRGVTYVANGADGNNGVITDPAKVQLVAQYPTGPIALHGPINGELDISGMLITSDAAESFMRGRFMYSKGDLSGALFSEVWATTFNNFNALRLVSSSPSAIFGSFDLYGVVA